MTTNTAAETVTRTAHVVTAAIIMNDSPYTWEYMYSDADTALKAVRAELRGTGVSMRKATNHESRLTNGGTSLGWDIYGSASRDASHYGYVVIRTGPLDENRPSVLVRHDGAVIAGTYTDGPQDTDDIAIAVADIAAKWHIAGGARKLDWTAPSKLTDRQQQNPENGDAWEGVHVAVREYTEMARPATYTAYDGSHTYTVYIPECDMCADHAIVSAWQNFRDSERDTAALTGTEHVARKSADAAAIRAEAHEYTHSGEYGDVRRCVECAGVARGARHESAHYAYDRFDQTVNDGAPEIVRHAAERVALWADPNYRRGEEMPEPFHVCVRNSITGEFSHHYMGDAKSAHELASTELERIAQSLEFVRAAHVTPKRIPDNRYVPGYVLHNSNNGATLAHVDVHAYYVTVAMARGEVIPTFPGTLYRSNLTGRVFANAAARNARSAV